MSLSHRYADFGSISNHADQSVVLTEDAAEEAKLEAFENGYQAGWEDAVKAHETARDRVAADFAQNLQDMSFTYHEAYAKLGAAMKPLLLQIVNKLLPEVARKTLGPHVLAEVTKLMDAQAENAIEIAVSPENLDSLQDLLGAELGVPFSVKAEPSLASGQVYLRVNKEEREINLDAVINGTSDALDAFFQQTEQEPQDG